MKKCHFLVKDFQVTCFVKTILCRAKNLKLNYSVRYWHMIKLSRHRQSFKYYVCKADLPSTLIGGE